MIRGKLNLVYGIYLDSNDRYVYDCILSILSINKYNNITSITIFTNKSVYVNNILKENIPEELFNKILLIQNTNLIDSIYNVCGDLGAHRYLTKGIFYRIQALTCCKNFLYLDTDIICTGKIKIPKFNRVKDIVKNIDDSSCMMYSYEGIKLEDLLYYIQYHKDHIKTLEFPDECIIHDGFGFKERLFDFKNLRHFGNKDHVVHGEFDFELWKALKSYILSADGINPELFDCYYRKPREEFLMKDVNN